MCLRQFYLCCWGFEGSNLVAAVARSPIGETVAFVPDIAPWPLRSFSPVSLASINVVPVPFPILFRAVLRFGLDDPLSRLAPS